jgi:hypothetical protein
MIMTLSPAWCRVTSTSRATPWRFTSSGKVGLSRLATLSSIPHPIISADYHGFSFPEHRRLLLRRQIEHGGITPSCERRHVS